MGNPWMKFYPRDWRGDQALRSVSIAARGFWMECLCIMHEAKPYGHLVQNGKPVGGDTLARMAGVPVEEARSLLRELTEAGVLSVTRKGVVFSRRMTKDHARAQKGKAAVKRRKDRSISANSDTPQASDTKQKSDAPRRLPSRSPSTQKPEARSQITPKPPDGGVSEGFDKFWEIYPRKVGKKAALRAWSAAVKAVPLHDILPAAERYAKSVVGKDPQYIAHASTWLNGQRWQDDLDTQSASPDEDLARWHRLAGKK